MTTLTLTLAQHLSSLVQARKTCAMRCAVNNPADTHAADWFNRHSSRIDVFARNFLPSGSGIDCGTQLDLDASHESKLVLRCSFHHMNEHGYYAGWSDYTITVRPAFRGFNLQVGGRDRNGVKEYLAQVFECALSTRLVEDAQGYTREQEAATLLAGDA